MTDAFLQTLRRRDVLLGLALFLAFLPLLGIVPYWFSVDPEVASAAASVGYNNQAAYILVVLAALLALGVLAMAGRRGYFDSPGQTSGSTSSSSQAKPLAPNKRHILEVGAVFLVVYSLYFPWFLARYGPYIEDSYFLTVLHRMHGGQQPYVDFEFVYGPLMAYLPYFWTKLTGFSMVSYFSFVALLEAVQFALLLVVLQRYFPTFRVRLAVLLLIGAFLFNTLLGPSWNGLRMLLPVFIMVLVATRPNSVLALSMASALLGVLLAYSHDFGIFCLVGVLAIYGLKVVRGQGLASALPAFLIVPLSAVVWSLITVALLGAAFPDYIESTFYTLRRFSAAEAAFPFYWTVNSLATFGLLVLALVIVGRALGKKGDVQIGAGDLLLFGGLTYSLVALKSGLNRADMWHLASPMLILIFAFVLPLPKQLFAYARPASQLAVALILVMGFTYLAALSPSGSYYARGLLLGFRDTAMSPGQAPTVMAQTRGLTIEPERSFPDPDVMGLGGYLADTERRERPVVLYAGVWGLDKRIGVYKQTYLTDDFLLSDQSGYAVRDFLQARPDAFIVMERQIYQSTFSTPDANIRPEPLRVYAETATKKVLSWLSTVHFNAVEIEHQEKLQRWDRTVGYYVRSHYHQVAEFGDLVVLEQKSPVQVKNKSTS